MNYWLVKSEPFEYSFQQLIDDGQTPWDGIRNYAARNHLRNMQVGDLVLYYHSRKGLEVVGIAEVISEPYPDPTAEKGDWSAVDMKPVKWLEKPVSLQSIKAEPSLVDLPLVRIGRLSVMPVQEGEFEQILAMGQTKI